ncbi:MAG TPA: CoA transferase, partial [Pseudonocardiaceae bacterium]
MSSTAAGPAPLRGVRVLDASSTLPGPYCTQLLADLGADVVAVERPGRGDPLRELMPGTFALLDRGKRRVALDLKDAADRVRLDTLLAAADVLVVGFRPAVTERLGLDAAAFAAHNPRGVHCAITGFGTTGGHRDRPGHDLNYLGLAGALRHAGDGTPAGEPALLV